MKRSTIIEAVWLVSLLGLSFVFFELVTGNSASDISMHDTYFSEGCTSTHLSLISLVLLYFIGIGFIVYLIRTSILKFRITSVNIILLIFAGLLLYFFSFVSYSVNHVVQPMPTDNTAPVTGLFYGCDITYAAILIPRILKIFLMLVLVFTGFVIGRNWRKSVN